MPVVIGQWKGRILNPPKVNERWRVALAGLVAALAIPFLVIDTPGLAEGIETVDSDVIEETPIELDAVVAPDPVIEPAVVEVVVIEEPVSPDIAKLATRASSWSAARSQAIANGLVDVRPPAPSDTDLSLLPRVSVAAIEEAVDTESGDVPLLDKPEEEAADEDPTEPLAETPAPEPGEEAEEPPSDQEAAEEEVVADGEGDGDAGDEPQDDPDVPVDTPDSEPTAPAQVDGRVPPPPGGPTAAQWDAVRNCESTHNYGAINHTGTYRGAYQFSQQTWDWVAGIHWPHLVGVDPAAALPAWQDIMAYTLYAMRGWDQWPICGQHLL